MSRGAKAMRASFSSRCLQYLQYQALQIVCFWNREQDGVVPRLCPPLQHSQLLAAIERGAGNYFQQVCFAHVVGTSTLR